MNTYTHTVHYYETDKMKITHHSNYIRFMEEARVDFLAQTGYGFDKLEEDGIVSPVMSVTCDYKHTTTFPDKIEIEVSVVKCSALKLIFGYTMRVESQIVATATSSHCFLDSKGKFVSLEATYPELFKMLQEMASSNAK
ncbi:MAG: acyl-CoA thioesterase [Bacteroidales bacterium]|nr:acyl-CoA thioesterase [Bacteroidales bacterium]